MSIFHQLSYPALLNLTTALEGGRLRAPFYPVHLTAYVPTTLVPGVTTELNRLVDMGMTEVHIAYSLRVLSEERAFSQHIRDQVDLVWTGHEVPGTESRDTAIVVRELLSSAQCSVLIASYAIDRGHKAQKLFAGLAAQMDANPQLQVKLFVNVHRPYQSQTSNSELLKAFAEDFREQVWPGKRLPQLFYDPRSLSQTGTKACLHAKCVVVDQQRLFITSANFTEAAHERNIEAGVLIVDPVAARAMQRQFEGLVERGVLVSVMGI